MPNFYIPLSGLDADSTSLNTIANNLSNMNTTGFKSQTTNFSDLFYQQVGTTGSGDQIQVGTGVQVASNSTDFSAGSITSTGISTDAAINGTGFFVLDNNGTQLYTRDGSFQTSATGTLESSDGLAVMGYGAVNGVVNTAGALSDIVVPTGQVMQPSATTSFSMTQNLNSDSPIGTTATGQVQVYDSLGTKYDATVTYTNLGDNTWSYNIAIPDTLTAAPTTKAAATTMAVPTPTPTPTTVAIDAAVVAPTVVTVPSTVSEGSPATTVSTSPLAAAVVTPASTSTTTIAQNTASIAGPNTILSYTTAPTGVVNGASSLTIAIGANTVTIPPAVAGESMTAYAGDINTALGLAGVPLSGITATGVNGVPGTNTAGSLSFSGTTASAYTVTGTFKQNVADTTTNYNFVTSNNALATVDPATTLSISEGGLGPVSAPAFTSEQSVSSYATSLQTALTTAGINDVTVSDVNGVLAIKGPANMTIGGTVTQGFTGTQSTYTFGSYTDPNTGLTAAAKVAPTTSLTITGPTTAGGTTTITVLPSLAPASESVAQYVTDLQTALTAAKITGVTVASANGQLTVTGPTNMTLAGTVTQDMLGTTNLYNFETNATVDPTTNLSITGETVAGKTVTITPPAVTTGETIAQYAAALTTAITTAGIANTTVTSTNGQLSIVGANLSTTGAVKQGLSDMAVNYNFGSTATVDPTTSITIEGPTVSGIPPTAITSAPTVTAGETVAEYALALSNALTQAGIDTSPDGVSVTATGGQLSIVGPAATLKTFGSATQDLSAQTISYNFGANNGALGTVDPSTNLTITGLTTSGATATTTAPTVVAGETLTSYATSLTNALATAGITGVTVQSTATGLLLVTGANISTAGNLVQNPVASANATGTLAFNTSGNLVNPSGDVTNITFAGLSDNAATMDMSWNLFGANGTGTISQTAAASEQSAQNANGYTSGDYESFTIGSDGTVAATYSNGQTQNVGQLSIATMSNEQGLVDVGATEYQTSASSGQASVGTAGAGGRGAIEGSSLEASNVNISAEFSDLIVAQRAFEANSKAVTTFDSITQETINMIH
jgi:flagellar hook protein FlgE